MDVNTSDIGSDSFITCYLIPKLLDEQPIDRRTEHLKRINGKLVWPVIALFPEKEWAQAINMWRWSVILYVVEKFNNDKSIQLTERNKRFIINKHVGNDEKLVVLSDDISLNCSTKLDSDVDITFERSSDELEVAILEVLTNRCLGSECTEISGNIDVISKIILEKLTKQGNEEDIEEDIKYIDRFMTICKNPIEFDIQRSLNTMLDIELFAIDRQFKGNNWTVDKYGELVPFITKITWEHSKLRLKQYFENHKILSHLDYPLTDLYLNENNYKMKYNEITAMREEHCIQSLISSNGYYTRPAFMYVVKQHGIVNTENDICPKMFNIDIVRNSYRALIMVVLENLGFALEYIDPNRHGLCPTLEDRAKKVAKYAKRISESLIDIRRIRERNGLLNMFSFNWWEVAGKSRGIEIHNIDSFNIAFNPLQHDKHTEMNMNTNYIRDILESKTKELLKNIKHILKNNKLRRSSSWSCKK